MKTINIKHYIEERSNGMDKRIKIKFIVIELILFLFLIIAIYNLNRVMSQSSNQTESKWNMIDNPGDVLRDVTISDTDWTDLPLSNDFRKKFNSHTGILNDETIKEVWYDRSIDKENQIVNIAVIDGLKWDDYWVHYMLNDMNELDDIEIVKHKLTVDENGKEIIYKMTMNENTYIDIILALADSDDGDLSNFDNFKYINVTENFKKKYSHGFISGRPYDYRSLDYIKELCSFEDRIVYLKSEYPTFDEEGEVVLTSPNDPNLTMYHRIHFFINEKNWLDDVEVQEMSEEEINKLLAEVKKK